MWFNNVIIYQLQTPFTTDCAEIHNALEEFRLKPCPPHARHTQGWINPFNDLDQKLYSIAGCHVIVAGKELRLLPSSVIYTALNEKMTAYELTHQKPMRRAERLQCKEEIEFDLLPKAFTIQKKDWLYIDTLKQWIVVNSATANKASEIIALLIKSLGSISSAPLSVDVNLSHLFGRWLSVTQSLPSGLSFGKRCVLINSQDDKSQYNCKDIEQNFNEINTLLEQGYAVSSIELNWQDRIQFILTDDFLLKRIQCLDYLDDAFKENGQLSNEQEKFDANFSLLAAEIRELVSFLVKTCQATELTVAIPEVC